MYVQSTLRTYTMEMYIRSYLQIYKGNTLCKLNAQLAIATRCTYVSNWVQQRQTVRLQSILLLAWWGVGPYHMHGEVIILPPTSQLISLFSLPLLRVILPPTLGN